MAIVMSPFAPGTRVMGPGVAKPRAITAGRMVMPTHVLRALQLANTFPRKVTFKRPHFDDGGDAGDNNDGSTDSGFGGIGLGGVGLGGFDANSPTGGGGFDPSGAPGMGGSGGAVSAPAAAPAAPAGGGGLGSAPMGGGTALSGSPFGGIPGASAAAPASPVGSIGAGAGFTADMSPATGAGGLGLLGSAPQQLSINTAPGAGMAAGPPGIGPSLSTPSSPGFDNFSFGQQGRLTDSIFNNSAVNNGLTDSPTAATAPGGGYTPSGWSPGLARLQNYADAGMTPTFAAADLANQTGESNALRFGPTAVDPTAVNPTSGALGISQDLGPRRAALLGAMGLPANTTGAQFAAAAPGSYQDQLDYRLGEIQNQPAYAPTLAAATNPYGTLRGDTYQVMSNFEAPSPKEQQASIAGRLSSASAWQGALSAAQAYANANPGIGTVQGSPFSLSTSPSATASTLAGAGLSPVGSALSIASQYPLASSAPAAVAADPDGAARRVSLPNTYTDPADWGAAAAPALTNPAPATPAVLAGTTAPVLSSADGLQAARTAVINNALRGAPIGAAMPDALSSAYGTSSMTAPPASMVAPSTAVPAVAAFGGLPAVTQPAGVLGSSALATTNTAPSTYGADSASAAYRNWAPISSGGYGQSGTAFNGANAGSGAPTTRGLDVAAEPSFPASVSLPAATAAPAPTLGRMLPGTNVPAPAASVPVAASPAGDATPAAPASDPSNPDNLPLVKGPDGQPTYGEPGQKPDFVKTATGVIVNAAAGMIPGVGPVLQGAAVLGNGPGDVLTNGGFAAPTQQQVTRNAVNAALGIATGPIGAVANGVAGMIGPGYSAGDLMTRYSSPSTYAEAGHESADMPTSPSTVLGPGQYAASTAPAAPAAAAATPSSLLTDPNAAARLAYQTAIRNMGSSSSAVPAPARRVPAVSTPRYKTPTFYDPMRDQVVLRALRGY